MAHLTIERLRELLHYDPETGVWTRRTKVSQMVPGQLAGWLDIYGYRVISVDGKKCRAARLAFFYITGRWPHPEIDHVNRDPADDRWQNLREATSRLNKLNRGMNRNNTSGFRGVSWDKAKRKWVATTKINYRAIHIGRFNSKEEAHQAYLAFQSTK